jgi:hypothetical protein
MSAVKDAALGIKEAFEKLRDSITRSEQQNLIMLSGLSGAVR